MQDEDENLFQFLGTYPVNFAWRLLDALKEAGVEVASGPLPVTPELSPVVASHGGTFGATGTIDIYVHPRQLALAGEIDGMVFGTGGVDSTGDGEMVDFPYLDGEKEDRTGKEHALAVWQRTVQRLARHEAAEIDKEIAALQEELGHSGLEEWRREAMNKALLQNRERRRRLLDGSVSPKGAPRKPSAPKPSPPGHYAGVGKSDRKMLAWVLLLAILLLLLVLSMER